MPRFAILDHDHPFPHWDFLLEAGAVLRAWRLLAQPEHNRIIVAEPLPDHRPLYLDYEGPVADDRGRVTRWDGGIFEWLLNESNELRVTLTGERIAGTVTICRVTDGWEWQCV
jgi:DNA polymerase Ligase (LigD)